MNALQETRKNLGLTIQQVASILGRTPMSVGWLLYRAPTNSRAAMQAATDLRIAVKNAVIAGARALYGNVATYMFKDLDNPSPGTIREVAQMTVGPMASEQLPHDTPLFNDEARRVLRIILGER